MGPFIIEKKPDVGLEISVMFGIGKGEKFPDFAGPVLLKVTWFAGEPAIPSDDAVWIARLGGCVQWFKAMGDVKGTEVEPVPGDLPPVARTDFIESCGSPSSTVQLNQSSRLRQPSTQR